MIRKLWQFNGGIHPDDHKAESTGTPISKASIPTELVIPLQQHIGQAAEPQVAVGDYVNAGQLIAQAEGYVSAPIHAPTSGTITAIEARIVPHPSGMSATCIVIATDGKDAWTPLQPVGDYKQIDRSELRNLVRQAGVVGLGGATFPSHVKLNPGPGHLVKQLIINAAECEPYITCDDMLMREQADTIIAGIEIIMHALDTNSCMIGIEDNKVEAIKSLQAAIVRRNQSDIEVVVIPTLYPAGGEKQLIKVLTGKEVPSNGLPLEIGLVCHNVGTAKAIYDAIVLGRPLVSRIVTITGNGVAQPQNFDVLIGTRIEDIIPQAGGYQESHAERLVMGGPMMGFALPSDEVPIVKMTNCVLVGDTQTLPLPEEPMPCIRCGACADACPADLLPQQLHWYAKDHDFDKAQQYNLFDCIECGCCAYVCPSHIPLVQYYRFAKNEIRDLENEKRKSDLARKRHEFHKLRLEREEAEAAAKRAAKRAALEKKSAAKDEKSDAIADAVKRAEARKENVNQSAPDAKLDPVAAAIAKAKSKDAPAKTVDPVQAAIDAAKKASAPETIDPVQAAMQAARAKSQNTDE